jgi:hypothetical protein
MKPPIKICGNCQHGEKFLTAIKCNKVHVLHAAEGYMDDKLPVGMPALIQMYGPDNDSVHLIFPKRWTCPNHKGKKHG